MAGREEAFLTSVLTGLPGPPGWRDKALVRDRTGVGGEGVRSQGVERERLPL